METLPALLHEVWERTPPEAQAYIRALEARVETLTSMVRALQEQVGTLQEQVVTVQVVKTGITPQLATSDRFQAAKMEPLHPAGRLHMRQ